MEYRDLVFGFSFFCFLLDLVLHLKKKSLSEKANTRFEKLIKDTNNQQAIKFDSSRLKVHAGSAHNYSLVILFTTNDPNVNCQMCPFIEKTFKETVKLFYSYFGNKVTTSSQFLKNPFFFGTCNVQDCYEILVQAGWNSVPKIVIIPPKVERSAINFRDWKELELNDLPTTDSISLFIAEHTRFPFIIERPLSETFGIYFLAILGIGLLMHNAYNKFRNNMFWFILVMGVFAISMAGLVYNSINKPPFSYKNPYNQQVHLIYPNSRQQFQIEGLIMAGLLSGISLSIIGFVHYVPYWKSGLNKRLGFALFSLIFGVFYILIWKIFKLKHPYYPF